MQRATFMSSPKKRWAVQCISVCMSIFQKGFTLNCNNLLYLTCIRVFLSLLGISLHLHALESAFWSGWHMTCRAAPLSGCTTIERTCSNTGFGRETRFRDVYQCALFISSVHYQKYLTVNKINQHCTPTYTLKTRFAQPVSPLQQKKRLVTIYTYTTARHTGSRIHS